MSIISGDFKKWLIIALGISFISFSFYAYQIFFTPNFNTGKDKKASVYLLIPTGGTFQNVLDTLEQRKWVEDKLSFMFLSKLMKYRDHVKPGRYEIKPNTSNLDLIKRLKRGYQTPATLIISENLRIKPELAENIGRYLEGRPDEFLKLMNDPDFVQKLGFDTTTIVSMFIPNTYQFYWNTSPKSFMEKMNKEYKKFWTEQRLEKAKEAGLTPVQVSVLASIVEAETNQSIERPRVAGVYINRLHSDMPLQADPTLVFAAGDFTIKRVMNIHKNSKSPYNTYKFTGLPPGPIKIPTKTSIDAVLNYEKHKYLYFCASPNEIGFHSFAENYRDQINNANLYRKYLDKMKIK
jgi:UPF0755 protein